MVVGSVLLTLVVLFGGVPGATADDFPSLISANASIAVILDREYLDEIYETTLAEIKKIVERVLREDLKNGGLVVYYYSWTRINLKKDFTAVFVIAACLDVWELYREAKAEDLVILALTEANCPRIPPRDGIMIPILSTGEELPQVVMDTKTANAFRWKSGILLHDDSLSRDMISRVILSLSAEAPDGSTQPTAISMFKLIHLPNLYERRREIRRLLSDLPLDFIGKNFLVVVSSHTMEMVMEATVDLGLVNTFTQWLYVIADTNFEHSNISGLAPLIQEGSNIAFIYNLTRAGEECVYGINCHSAELFRGFVLGLSKMIKEELTIYGQISDEEWETIRPTKPERRDNVLFFLRDYINKHSPCDNCTTWKIEAGEIWGRSYDTKAVSLHFGGDDKDKTQQNNLLLVGFWGPSNGLRMRDVLFPHVFQGFRGKNLHIVTYHNPPWQIITYNESGLASQERSKGVILDILKNLAVKLNFTYTLHVINTGSFNQSFFGEDTNLTLYESGHLLTTNVPMEILGYLQQNRILMAAIAATVNDRQKKYLNFTIPISIQPYSFLVARPKELSRMFLFLRPFTPDTWLALFATLVMMGPLLYIINRLSPYYTFHRITMKGGLGKFANCFWYIYGALLQQGGLYLPEADSGRILIGTWWLVVIVFVTTYCGNLVAFLTFPKIDMPITTIAQLVRHSETIDWGIKGGTFLEEYIKSTDDPKYAKLYAEAAILEDEAAEIIQRVREGTYVYIDWKTNLQYIMKREFLKFDRCDFALGAEEFLDEQISITMPLLSPYLNLINLEIKRLHQMGLIDLWLREYMPKKDRCWQARKNTDVENHSVTMEDMQGCFLVLVLGVAGAIVIILFEFCWYYRWRTREKKLFKPFVH